jgi:hypothetical protein
MFRVTRRVCETIAQNVAQLVYGQNRHTTLTRGKSGPNFLDVSVIFKITAKSKQWPTRRKIAQSGHPDYVFLMSHPPTCVYHGGIRSHDP